MSIFRRHKLDKTLEVLKLSLVGNQRADRKIGRAIFNFELVYHTPKAKVNPDCYNYITNHDFVLYMVYRYGIV